MHLSLEDLIAVRDGEARADSARHAASCPECIAELSRLRSLREALAALPDEPPSRDLWPVVKARATAERQHRIWIRVGWVAAGLAAVFTLLIGVRGAIEAYVEAKVARQAQALIAESQRLEQELHASERQGRVMSGRTAGTVVQLEDRIAYLDSRLSRAEGERFPSQEILGLWQERVRLLDALVSVEATGTTYVGL
jgi:anti-sigma factor RsiW